MASGEFVENELLAPQRICQTGFRYVYKVDWHQQSPSRCRILTLCKSPAPPPLTVEQGHAEASAPSWRLAGY